MARQSTTPVQFTQSTRRDAAVTMSSARAGVVVPVTYIPLLAEDSASGSVGIDVQLKEMPKPLLNGVQANFQAWFVPKTAHPQFPGRDEYMHAYTGEAIKALGADDRDPPPFFTVLQGQARTTAEASVFFKTLGLHVPQGVPLNTDLLDAFSVIYNFRLAAHSSRLTRRPYASEDIGAATTLPRAFWPSSRLSRVVPDYERALILGNFDLDIAVGQVRLRGDGKIVGNDSSRIWRLVEGDTVPNPPLGEGQLSIDPTGQTIMDDLHPLYIDPGLGNWQVDFSNVWGEIGGAGPNGTAIGITLADIDKARTTQAFAKLRTAYAGNDATGFDNDETLVALLMQGMSVPPEEFKRPWLLDSARVPVGFAERFATDAANLDQSVTLGRASAVLRLNVPRQDVGGVIVVTLEVLPERIDERMCDDWISADAPNDLPNALRDIQRVEPVDYVPNRRIDAKHNEPGGLYGYEPMNDRWNRDFTRLGGDFYMAQPGGGWTENRSNIWQTEIVNPKFSDEHYLAPAPFPHSVFSDANADAFEFVARHNVAIRGLTQIGDVLAENNDDYDAVKGSGMPDGTPRAPYPVGPMAP
ncbi:hypothetical protein [Paracoccus pacificus]|uniref:Major capsid protein n=1 Tax=Paracoccus pacificus TaxID=1463598 RepID=A0ABW4R408_9RHOB